MIPHPQTSFFFCLNDPAPTEISPLPLPDALPIPRPSGPGQVRADDVPEIAEAFELVHPALAGAPRAVHEAHGWRAGARRGIRDLKTIDRDRTHEGLRYIMPGGGQR